MWARLVDIMREALASPDIDDTNAEPQQKLYKAIMALQRCITLKVRRLDVLAICANAPSNGLFHKGAEPQRKAYRAIIALQHCLMLGVRDTILCFLIRPLI